MIYSKGKIHLEEDESEVVIKDKNFIVYEGQTYFLKYLDPQYKSSKGGNSSVFSLYTDEGNVDLVVKICNIFRPSRKTPQQLVKRYGRFIREIEALKFFAEKEKQNIVRIVFHDLVEISGNAFPYYVMNKAETDLKDFMLKNEVDDQEKFKFCSSIFHALKEIHDEGFYHRDIKPDNILLFKEENSEDEAKLVWKIADLGLVGERDNDYDDVGEKIGPVGWLSPEAMNKFLTEKFSLGFDCKIDEHSDIFQLGKLFWFIYNLNVPIGQICEEDFKYNNILAYELYVLFFGMVEHSKERRLKPPAVELALRSIQSQFYI